MVYSILKSIPNMVMAFLHSWNSGNLKLSAQCYGSRNGTSQHTIVLQCVLEMSETLELSE